MPPPRTRPARILVVEPSTTQALVLCSLLRRDGHDVVQAGPDVGTDDRAFDLVIAEPEFDDPRLEAGLQALLAGGVAWLALMPSDPAHTAAAAADAAAWVRKPVRPQHLRDAVALCLGRAQLLAPVPGIDMAAIAALWGSPGNASFHRVAAVFLGEMEQRLTALDHALAAIDRAAVLLEAHSIGSAAASVGCARIAETAQALEAAAAQAAWPALVTLNDLLAGHAAEDLRSLACFVGLAHG